MEHTVTSLSQDSDRLPYYRGSALQIPSSPFKYLSKLLFEAIRTFYRAIIFNFKNPRLRPQQARFLWHMQLRSIEDSALRSGIRKDVDITQHLWKGKERKGKIALYDIKHESTRTCKQTNTESLYSSSVSKPSLGSSGAMCCEKRYV